MIPGRFVVSGDQCGARGPRGDPQEPLGGLREKEEKTQKYICHYVTL